LSAGRILVVDDEESIRSTLNDYFADFDYNVVTASDGEDALKKFVPAGFDCIISDLSMPNINGLELLKRIKKQDEKVLFIIITGYPSINSAISAMEEGAYDYITKPFHMEDIRLKVENALKNKKTKES
jgi:two-component system response regulator PilR (NtrC family)